MAQFEITVKAFVNDGELGLVTYRIRSTNEDRARATAMKRQLATLREQFPAAKSREVVIIECGCGHPYHGDEPCTGTLGTVSDGDWVAATIHKEGRVADEPCVCTEYVPL